MMAMYVNGALDGLGLWAGTSVDGVRYDDEPDGGTGV